MEKKEIGISRIEKSPDIPSLVARQIVDLISEGRLKPGDKLPSEHEMTNLFGVSRISLREAMKLLEAKGYIESRDRRGKFVRSVVDTMRSPIEELISIDHAKIWELLYVRRIIEAEAAYLAAKNATDDQVKQMKEISEKAIQMGIDTLLNTKEGGIFYTMFFDILADSTRNTVFMHLRRTITTILKGAFPYSRKKLSTVKGSSKEIFSQLIRICDAIEERDPEAARMATIEHIDYIEKSLRQALGQTK
jgi:GntR family transcriptional repressor for pyruvate dehydrogenase complex